MKDLSPIKSAIAACGGPAEVAKLLRVSVPAVYFWRAGKREFPAEHCPTIERATEGKVRCEDLRPDVDWAYLRGNSLPPVEHRTSERRDGERRNDDRRHEERRHEDRRRDHDGSEPSEKDAA